ncbi:hypothetical protein H0H92_016159 [Tricholoma furcatifolium]|nr:hypothetical protein H0H92_016159 [Tricholoma furcatifolium]
MTHPSSSSSASSARRSQSSAQAESQSTASKAAAWREFLEELQKGAKKARQGKEIKGPLSAYYLGGKLIPRLVHPFLDLRSIFMHGLIEAKLLTREACTMTEDEDQPTRNGTRNGTDGDESDDDEEPELTPKELHLNAYRELLRLVPCLEKNLKKLCKTMDGQSFHDSVLNDLVEVFLGGSSSARTADTRKIHSDLSRLLDVPALKHFIPTLSLPLPYDKSSRGFIDNNTALMLCPARFRYQFSDEFRMSLNDGRVEVTAHDFPVFMYDASHEFLVPPVITHTF